MYNLVLILHSWIRWAAVVAGVGATFSVLRRAPASGSGTSSDSSGGWGLAFLITMDLQLMIGLLLYFVLSPTTAAIREDFGASMRDPVARFWAVEHVSMMLLAVVLVHVGRVLARRAKTPGSKRVRLLVCFGLATAAMLAGTPWPGMVSGRPFLRL